MVRRADGPGGTGPAMVTPEPAVTCPIDTLLETATVFHEGWWREAVAEAPHRLAVVEKGGRLLGAMPYQVRRRFGVSLIGQPGLSHVLGPVIDLPPGKANTNLRHGIEVTTQLIEQLPRHLHCFFRLHCAISESLAFNLAGFDSGVDFTVRIAPAAKPQLWAAMKDKTRNVLRRAEETYDVRDLEADDFVAFYDRSLRERQAMNFYGTSQMLSAIRAATFRGRGRCRAAFDRAGQPVAAVFTVWDRRSEYYLLSARSAAATAGAVSLLIWHALQHAAANGREFDLDGIHIQEGRSSNLLLLTGFGGRIAPRITVKNVSALGRMAMSVRQLRR